MEQKNVGALLCLGLGLGIGLMCRAPRQTSAEEDNTEVEALRKRKDELSVELMSLRNSRMMSAESIKNGRSFAPRSSDVFIVTYPKCGTTWMSQIVHALRTHGRKQDFESIEALVPWDVLALDCGQDLAADHPDTAMRAFKSHEAYADIAKGGKYIYVARDPLDAFVSFHKFLPAFCQLRSDDLSAEGFMNAIFGGTSHSGQIWNHYRDWWAVREDPNVLWVCYEDMKQDLRGSVARVAAFIGVEVDDALLDEVTRLSSFAYMSAPENIARFDGHYEFDRIKEQMGFQPSAIIQSSKVAKGKVGQKKSLPAMVRERLSERWTETMLPATGFQSYGELRAAVNKL